MTAYRGSKTPHTCRWFTQIQGYNTCKARQLTHHRCLNASECLVQAPA